MNLFRRIGVDISPYHSQCQFEIGSDNLRSRQPFGTPASAMVSLGLMRLVTWVFAAVSAALLFVIAAAYAFNHKARADATTYLRTVMPMRIDTPYDAAIKQLRDAGLASTQVGDCPKDCTLSFLVADKWLYKLRLALPVGFYGRLDFHNGTLVYKSTSMGQDVMVWSATVAESPSQELQVSANEDSLGQVRQIHVHLSPSDFTANRRTAYAFNVACIGSMRGCTAVDYLPWNELRQLAHK